MVKTKPRLGTRQTLIRKAQRVYDAKSCFVSTGGEAAAVRLRILPCMMDERRRAASPPPGEKDDDKEDKKKVETVLISTI